MGQIRANEGCRNEACIDIKIDQKKRGDGLNEIVVACITGGLTLLGVLISNNKTQAVTETKLEELTREVREHNNFAKRMPVVEEQIKVINHRIEDLEELNK